METYLFPLPVLLFQLTIFLGQIKDTGAQYLYPCTRTELLISNRRADDIKRLMSASSVLSNQERYAAEQSNLDTIYSASDSDPSGGAWCSDSINKNQWIQMDLKRRRVITGFITQGRHDPSVRHWVNSLKISYSDDGFSFQFYKMNGTEFEFTGNNDQDTRKINYFAQLYPFQDERLSVLVARYVRLHPQTWNVHICLRWDVIGCRDDNPICGTPNYTTSRLTLDAVTKQVTASSFWTQNKKYHTGLSVLDYPTWSVAENSGGGWCAQTSQNQWLQMDLLYPTLISGIVTQGLNDSNYERRVVAYKIAYALDEHGFINHKLDGVDVVFEGNYDQNTKVINTIAIPFAARYVRLIIVEYIYDRPCLRWDVLTCEADPKCRSRYTQIHTINENLYSNCKFIVSIGYGDLNQCRHLACSLGADIFNSNSDALCIVKYCGGPDKKLVYYPVQRSNVFSAEE